MNRNRSACLKASCTPETKAAFKALANENGISVATLLRKMVERVLKSADKPGGHERSDGRGGRGGRLMVRLTEAEVRRIRELAEAAGQSGPGWIVALIRLHLDKATPFAKDDLAALETAAREVGAVGRNLNMIAHRLMRTDRYAEAWEPQRLGKAVDAVRREVNALLLRAARRYGEAHG